MSKLFRQMEKSCCTTDFGVIFLAFPFLPASSRLPRGLGLHKECVWRSVAWEGTGRILEFAIWFLNAAVLQEGTVGKKNMRSDRFGGKMLFMTLIGAGLDRAILKVYFLSR